MRSNCAKVQFSRQNFQSKFDLDLGHGVSMPGWQNESITDNKHVNEVSSHSMKGNRNEKELCESPVFGDVEFSK